MITGTCEGDHIKIFKMLYIYSQNIMTGPTLTKFSWVGHSQTSSDESTQSLDSGICSNASLGGLFALTESSEN